MTGDAPLLEVNTLRQGLVLDEKKIAELPVQSNMPLLLARFAPGMSARGVIPFAGQGFVGGPTTNATPLGGVGGVDWSIDGASNNGVGRQMSTSPNTDMLQEMRVESTNFTASIGHGTGVGITMMTRAGTNTPRGTLNYQHWSNKFNPPNQFQDAVFDANPRARSAYEDGASHNASTTFGGPVKIPRIIDGTNKLFMFANYSYGHDDFNGKSATNRTIPRSDPGHNHLAGDFSDLLLLPNPAQYVIYDPLTTRPDPNRAGHVIRTPFPNNIIPRIGSPTRFTSSIQDSCRVRIRIRRRRTSSPSTTSTMRRSRIRSEATSLACVSITTTRTGIDSSGASAAATSPKVLAIGRTRAPQGCTHYRGYEKRGPAPEPGLGSPGTRLLTARLASTASSRRISAWG